MPFLIETDLLIGYTHTADRLHPFAEQIFDWLKQGFSIDIALATSSFIEYDVVLRSKGYDLTRIYDDITDFYRISKFYKIPVFPLNAEVYELTIHLRQELIAKYSYEYESLLYQDSLHIATALVHTNHLITTDELIQEIIDDRRIPLLNKLIIEPPGDFIDRMRRERGFP